MKQEEMAGKDDDLTNQAKEKVGQAKSDSDEAQKQVEKAAKEIQTIMAELESLRDIHGDDLDALGKCQRVIRRMNEIILIFFLEKRLGAAEAELNRANLTERLEIINERKNMQNKQIKNYQKEISELEGEVANIKSIADSLPSGCFKRTRLEP
jgi:laminin, gamma 1